MLSRRIFQRCATTLRRIEFDTNLQEYEGDMRAASQNIKTELLNTIECQPQLENLNHKFHCSIKVRLEHKSKDDTIDAIIYAGETVPLFVFIAAVCFLKFIVFVYT